jgi:pimeloyl-ACP methyl ester carboxylesterase
VTALFVPGWGARASLYHDALPPDWEVLQPPSFRATRGRIEATFDWFRGELVARPEPIVLGGHSFGAALSVIATARGWSKVDRLVLVSPAGLPLSKPMHRAGLEFLRQFVTGVYPVRAGLESALGALVAPAAALGHARSVYRLDLRTELVAIRERGIPVSVVTANGDTMTTVESCREIARLAGGSCDVLDVPGGHVWFLRDAPQLRRRLAL